MAEIITNFLMQSSMMTFAVKVALVVEAAVKICGTGDSIFGSDGVDGSGSEGVSSSGKKGQ